MRFIHQYRFADGGGFDPVTYFGSALVLYLDAALGITMGGTLLAAGTSPPAVTVSGSGRLAGLTASIDSTAGGTALGQATFKYSIDNGSTWVATGVATGASVALGGDATGYTVSFPTGTYNTDQTWRGTCSQWSDQTISGRHASQGTASKQPVITVAGSGGAPYLAFDGVNDFLATASFTARSQPETVLAALRWRTTPAGYAHDAITVNCMGMYAYSATQVRIYAGGGDPIALSPTQLRVYEEFLSGASSTLGINGGDPSGLTSVGSSTYNGLTIGARGDTASSANVDVYMMAIIARSLSPFERRAIGALWTKRLAL